MVTKNDSQDVSSPLIDFGRVFADGAAVCDFSICCDEIAGFIPTVAGLLGRQIDEHELRECETSLRRQYLSRHPFTSGVDEDTATYVTPWFQQNGTQICLKITLLKRSSLAIPTANKKMAQFVICEKSGKQLGTIRSLPWIIDNFHDIGFSIRALSGHRFESEILGSRLLDRWIESGASDELPCTLYLGETACGEDISIRFLPAEDEIMDAEEYEDVFYARKHVVAVPVVEGVERSVQKLLPTMFRTINPSALYGTSYLDFIDIAGHATFLTRQMWRTAIWQRYDYLRVFQNKRGKKGIISVQLQGGIQAEVFHSGEYTVEGDGVFGLCRDRGRDGRWNCVNWLLARHLHGAGVTELPAAPDMSLERHPFDPQLPVDSLAPHVLDHASRWADKATLTGAKDQNGCDVFVSDQARAEMFEYAKSELGNSLARATMHPATTAYGYYNPVADRVRGECSPISILLPGFYEECPDGSKEPRAVFVLRIHDASTCPHYKVPTILPISFARRSARVLGTDMPAWMW